MHFDSPQLARDFIASSWETLNRLRIEKKWSEAEALSGESLSLTRQLYDSDKSVLNTRLLASAICGRADLRYARGDFRKAQSTFAEANRLRECTLDSASDEGFLLCLAYGYRLQADCLLNLERQQEAVALFKKAADVYERTNSDIARYHHAVCVHHLCCCYYALGAVEDAFQYGKLAEELYCASLVAGVIEAEDGHSEFRNSVESVIQDFRNVAEAKSFLRERIQHYTNLPTRPVFNTIKLWLNEQLLDRLFQSGSHNERANVLKEILDCTLKSRPSSFERAECEKRYSCQLALSGKYSLARVHNLLAKKYFEKHLRHSGGDDSAIYIEILEEQECFKELAGKFPEPSVRKCCAARLVDMISLVLFGLAWKNHRRSKIVTRLYVQFALANLLFFFEPHGSEAVAQVGTFFIAVLLGAPPPWTSRFLKRLADGFESKFLSKLARKLKLRLPASLANTVLVESKGDLQFRVWAVGFAFPIGMLVQTADDLAGRDLAIWVFVFVSPRPTIRDRELRRCMSAINLSMPHSANRQLFSLLARGTHPLGLGTC
ncbi:MAG: tetratricopeptide repeat protein [Pirellulaceae bacterium]|nr:tetratricopeptide repeat protein [Pirellulaceae bacterium]